GHHERLFVRERDALPGAQRRERRLESRRADDPVDDDADVGMSRGLDEAGSTLPPSPVRRPIAIYQADERRFPFGCLLIEQRFVPVPRERHAPNPPPLSRQHLESGRADRPGRAEDGNATAHITPKIRYNPAAVGITKYSESSRSRTPP